jgi:hypothetical protein
VRQTFAAELPVPSDSRTIFRLMESPRRVIERPYNLWFYTIARPSRV